MGKIYKQYLWCSEAAKNIPRKTIYRLKKARDKTIAKDSIGRSLGLYNTLVPSVSHQYNVPDIRNAQQNIPQKQLDDSNMSTNSSSSDSSNTESELPLSTKEVTEGDNKSVSSVIESENYANKIIADDDISISNSDTSSGSTNSLMNEDNTPKTYGNLDEEIYPDSNLSLKQSLLLTMAHILRHKESKGATDSLLKLLSFHIPENSNLPQSVYLYYKHFQEAKENFFYHMICDVCKSYIGLTDKRCNICNKMIKFKDSIDKGNYFIVFSIQQQIEALLDKKYSGKVKIKRNNNLKNGEEYGKLPIKKGRDLSITWNTDGVPVFHSSGYSLWPLLYVVNEIQFSGQNDVKLAALWFGVNKPEMNSFLKPFVDEMNELSGNGFEHVHNGKSRTIKVFPGPLSCDSVARCVLQNFHQFNGTYGCNWCLNEGRRIARGNGGARIYDPELGEKRNVEQSKRDARSAISTGKPVNGVKGFSILMLLNYFNLIDGCVVDYMHAVCQGVVKATNSLWFDSENHQKEFYISGKKTKDLDAIFLSLKPSDELTRTPRTIKDRKQWKANEWRSWLLFYSPVILENVLPKKYYNHWLKLVNGISLLLMEDVTLAVINEAEKYLTRFVQQYGNLYGEDNLTFNVHLLLHLPETVKNWGQLTTVSCFPFENMNGKLMKLFHGTQNVPMQIAEKIVILEKISVLAENTFPTFVKGSAGKCFNDLLKGYPLIQKSCAISEGIFCYGLPSNHNLNPLERNALSPYQPTGKVEGHVSKFLKINVFGVKFSSKEVAKRNNCGVKLKDGTLGIIDSFYSVKDPKCPHLTLVCPCDISYFVIIKKLKVYHISQEKSQLFYKTKALDNTLVGYPVCDIDIKVLIFKSIAFKEYIYVLELKHKFESD